MCRPGAGTCAPATGGGLDGVVRCREVQFTRGQADDLVSLHAQRTRLVCYGSGSSNQNIVGAMCEAGHVDWTPNSARGGGSVPQVGSLGLAEGSEHL
jgi:hypothetical protein